MSSCNIASLPYRVWPQGVYGDRQISVVNPFWVSFLCVDQIEASTSSPDKPSGSWTFEDWFGQIPSPTPRCRIAKPCLVKKNSWVYWVSPLRFLRVFDVLVQYSITSRSSRALRRVWRQANLNCSLDLSCPSSTSSCGQTFGHSRFWRLVCPYLSIPPQRKKIVKIPHPTF